MASKKICYHRIILFQTHFFMRKQDQLSTLIGALSKNEKRYFKLQASIHSGDKTFIYLFDEMVKGETYAPEKLSKKLNISKPRLAHEKKYLEKALLNSMRTYEQDNDVKIWLNNQWQAVQVLFNKRQFELALSINEKAMQKAQAYENFIMVIDFLRMKHLLLMFLGRIEEASKAEQQRISSIDQFTEAERMLNLLRSFNTIAMRNGDPDLLLKKIVKREEFKTTPEKLKSNSARVHWHAMKGQYYVYVAQDLKASIYHQQCNLKIFEAQPQLIYTLPQTYLNCLNSLSLGYGLLGNYEESLMWAEKLEFETDGHRKDIPANFSSSKNLEARSTQVNIHCHQSRYDATLKKIAEIGDEINNLQLGVFVLTKHCQARALFYTGKYDEALRICLELQNINADMNTYMLFNNRLLFVMIHHALKNYSLLPHIVNSVATWAKRHEVRTPGTDAVLRFFRKLETTQSASSKKAFFIQFEKEIKKNTFEYYVWYLDLSKWVADNLLLPPPDPEVFRPVKKLGAKL